jgi:8-oxo-dGTP pyrophosphatase MutT (NUDIX family)
VYRVRSVGYGRRMLDPRPEASAVQAGAPVQPTNPVRQALAGMTSPRIVPDPPPPWRHLAAGGWRPSVDEVRRGFAAAPAGGPADPLVPSSRESAVLVLVCPGRTRPRAGEAHVVLIERSHSSGTHRGDIAFPGGVLHDGESPVDGALRETQEEIGIPPEDVEVIASLDVVPTLTAFMIAPFVGVLRSPPSFVLDPAEIERVFVVPLIDLMREDAYWLQAWTPDAPSLLPFFAIGDAVGWGTTGALLVRLLTAAVAGHRMDER